MNNIECSGSDNKIREYRKSRGLTQSELAEKLGIRQSVLSRYESGEMAITIKRLADISSILNCTISELIGENNSDAVSTIGTRIRDYRRAAGKTQTELAAALGVTASMIGQYETGIRTPRENKLKEIAAALNISPLLLKVDYEEIYSLPKDKRLTEAFSKLDVIDKEKVVSFAQFLASRST